MAGPLKGRGSSWAIAHRFVAQSAEAFDDGWGTLAQQASVQRIPPATQILEQRARSILAPRLPWEVNPIFQRWLEQHFPDRAARVMARVREMRGGRDNDPRFGTRMRGEGVWADLLAQRLRKACARLGLSRERVELDLMQFRRPRQSGQAELF